MTETIADSARPATRQRAAGVLAGVFFAYTVFNLISALLWHEDDSLITWPIMGAYIVQPMLFGTWAALASGSLWTRLPIVVPSLMLLIVAQGIGMTNIGDVERRNFVATVIAGFIIFSAAFVVFLIVRKLASLRIALPQSESTTDSTRIRFSIKYLLSLLTVYAVLFGITSQLRFQQEPSPPSFIFGPDFFIEVLIVGGLTLSAAVLPTLVVPLFILYGRPPKRLLWLAIAFWAAVFSTIIAYWAFGEGEDMPEMLGVILLSQLGAVIVEALTALSLRRVGYRLVRTRSAATPIPQPPVPSL